MLTDLNTLKGFLSIALTDTSQDTLLNQLVGAADGVVKGYCKQALELAVNTEYRSGPGTQDLALYQTPVQAPRLAGTLTNGQPTVTGISDTGGLLAGMPAIALQVQTQGSAGQYDTAIPVGATILTVDSATQVTLSANSTKSGAFTILFGLTVYLDAAGFAGDGPGGFSSITQLVLGQDYALKRDQPSGASKSGVLSRMGFGSTGGPSMSGWPQQMRMGTLTARMPPPWSMGVGNIKIVYAAGYKPVPLELTDAANQVAAWIKRTGVIGGLLASETIGRYSYALHFPVPGQPPEVGSVRQILARYRDVCA